ncbi:MAG TPA: hypothetical protein PLI45_04430 [Candidatus Woesebacteria bacterium]|nr:hypothetical protein [Candidatus Woesebacteria bacterium]
MFAFLKKIYFGLVSLVKNASARFQMTKAGAPLEDKDLDIQVDRPTIIKFINLLRKIGNREDYIRLVKRAQKNYSPLNTASLSILIEVLSPFTNAGSPGHDFGHARRDLLAAFALATDKNVATYQPAEVLAGIIAGAFHDIGTAITPRYQDSEWLGGHAEVGAWLFYELTDGILEKNLRLLIAYAITSHTHYLKTVECADGSKRDPWYYELVEVEGKKYGWAVLACRFADRLDTNGCTLAPRHLLANADVAESPDQHDFSGSEFYEINRKTIDVIVTPRKAMIDIGNGKTAPTAIQHINNFANSNFGNSVYSRDDHLFPTMSRLMGYKVAQATDLGLSFTPSIIVVMTAFFVPSLITKKVRSFFLRISRAPRFEESWAVLEKAFSKLSREDLARWSYLTDYMSYSYDRLLMVLKNTIVENSSVYTKPVLPLLDDLIAEVS